MTQEAQSVLQEALTFAEQERAEIAGALLQSLEAEPESDVETAWRQEVAVRVASRGTDGAETTPWEVIRSRFRARLSERRQS